MCRQGRGIIFLIVQEKLSKCVELFTESDRRARYWVLEWISNRIHPVMDSFPVGGKHLSQGG